MEPPKAIVLSPMVRAALSPPTTFGDRPLVLKPMPRCWARPDKAIRLVSRLAQCFEDDRDADATIHKLPALIGQHIFAIALGYEDINDHDQLGQDPMLGVLAGTLTAKRANYAPPAGKSTLNRLEHAARVGADPYHKITPDMGPSSGCS